MGDSFYRAIVEFHRKYRTVEEKEKALEGMSVEEIMQLARSASSVQEACWFAKAAQRAAAREQDAETGVQKE